MNGSVLKNKKIWIENLDCIDFLKKIPDKSIDLILTDPPFGINEKNFKVHYKRNSKNIIDGYVEAPKKISYEKWVFNWVKEFDRILKDNGTCLIFSGWNKICDLENAIRKTKKYKIINHLIWNYNFGVFTKKKFVSSHYHILYFSKIKGKPFFNNQINKNENDLFSNKKSYEEIQDVIKIKKEFQKNKFKNSNKLPSQLIEKLILHTTKIDDTVLDIFSGNFTTAFSALKLKRIFFGCEINKKIYDFFINDLEKESKK